MTTKTGVNWLILTVLLFASFATFLAKTSVALDLENEYNFHSDFGEGFTGLHDDSKCGGLIETTSAYSLTYKFQKPLVQYESCIWLVSVQNRSTIKLNLTDTYYRYTNNNNEHISVGFFNKSNYDQFSMLTWIKFPYSVESQILEVAGPVIFVHLVSIDAHPGLGFRLNILPGEEEQSSIYHFENYYLDSEYGTFSYPQNGGRYINNQRTVILLKPESGLPATGTATISDTYVRNRGIEDSLNCTVDSLNIYGLGPTAAAWTKYATICGSTPSLVGPFKSYNPRNDPIILTFKTDDSGVDNGFELYWRSF